MKPRVEISRITRALAGGYYYAAQWSRDPATAARTVAAFAARISATRSAANRISVPTLMLTAALAAEATAEDIDTVYDLIAGRACLGAIGREASEYGYGSTLHPLRTPTEPYMVAVVSLDLSAHTATRGNAVQRALAAAAAVRLGEQYGEEIEAESIRSDSTGSLSRLDIARRLRLLAFLDFTPPETGDPELDEYATSCAEDDGSEMFARFASAIEKERSEDGETGSERAAGDRDSTTNAANETEGSETPQEADGRGKGKANATAAELAGRAAGVQTQGGSEAAREGKAATGIEAGQAAYKNGSGQKARFEVTQ